MAAYMYVGVGYLVMAPIMYTRLYSARDKFDLQLARQREAEEDEDHLNLLGALPIVVKREIRAMDLFRIKEFVFAMLCMVFYNAMFLYVTTILNPMLREVHNLDTEASTLFYVLSGISFLMTTPIAFYLRSRKIMKRRVIMFVALCIMGLGMIIRTGDFRDFLMITYMFPG